MSKVRFQSVVATLVAIVAPVAVAMSGPIRAQILSVPKKAANAVAVSDLAPQASALSGSTPRQQPPDLPSQDSAATPADARVAREAVVSPGDSPVGNVERLQLRVLSLSLDMHLNSDTGAVTTRARMRVQNAGATPLSRVALQVSSALTWQSARLAGTDGSGKAVALQQFHVTTDTDHTGAVTEAVLTLPTPLPAASDLNLDLYFGGTLSKSAERLLRLGAPDERTIAADWDGVSPGWTGLRGFGNVLWFPVASPAALLPAGDQFGRAVDAERERSAGTEVELRLTLEHNGAAPETAWFLGRPAQLLSPLRRRPANPGEAAVRTSEPPAAGTAEGDISLTTGQGSTEDETAQIAVAHWEPEVLRGRPMSLFIAAGDERGDAPVAGDAVTLPQNSAVASTRVQVVGGDTASRESYQAAAAKIVPVLRPWLPARAAGRLTVLSLPSPGTQPFADGGLLVLPVHPDDPAALAESLVYPVAAAAMPAEAPAWIREGVPEFLRLQYLLVTGGRDRMQAELGNIAPALRAAEAARGMDPLPLETCLDAPCARYKAVYALLMLEQIAGEAPLQQALAATLLAGAADTGSTDKGTLSQFENALQRSSGKDLRWFFADWFRANRGLPDLQIVQVAPRRVDRSTASVIGSPEKRPVGGPIGNEPEAEPDDPRRVAPSTVSRNTAGLPDGSWLVAVEVQNNGDAIAEVPVIVQGGGLRNQLPLRIPAHGRATIRVPFETTPEQVLVNDGVTPEQHAGTHRRAIEISRQP